MAAKYKKIVNVNYYYIGIIALYRYTCMYNFNSYCHEWEKRIYVMSNKEFLSDHRLEIPNVAAKCNIFVTVI